jgi:hypothetical protein
LELARIRVDAKLRIEFEEKVKNQFADIENRKEKERVDILKEKYRI